MFQLPGDFAAQVGQALQVLAGLRDAAQGFAPAFLVQADSGRFLQMGAQGFRLGIDDLADHALFDDGVAARAQPGAQEQLGHIALAAAAAIEEVLAVAVAINPALDRNFVERGEFTADLACTVVKQQLHRGLRHRLARGRAGEDHIGE